MIDVRKLAPLFFERHGLARSVGRLSLRQLTTALGLEPQGRDHSGIDDARNVARALARMVEIGQSVPQVSRDGVYRRVRWCMRDNLLIDRPARYAWMGKRGVCTWTDPGVDLDLEL